MKIINQSEPDGSNAAAIVSFEDALRVCEGLEQVEDYTKKLAYWDSHPAIFGESGIVIFDTQKKIFESLYAQTDLWGLSDSDIGQYRVFRIEPNGLDEFFPFMDWCIHKCNFWNHYEITDERYYWERIKKHDFPEEYLPDMLIRAEEIRNRIQSLPNPFGNITVDNELAKDYFFWYGNQEASNGGMGGFRVEFYLSSVFKKISPRSLSDYGCIFSRFYHGYHTAKMVRFLRDQKKRFDKGEVYTVPFVATPDNDNEAPATVPPPATDQPPAPPTSTPATDENIRLTHSQIAIFCHINEQPINKNNANEIAQKYGQTSGQKLNSTYEQLTSELVRTAKGKNRVKDYREISSLILPKRKAQYDKELKDVIANNVK